VRPLSLTKFSAFSWGRTDFSRIWDGPDEPMPVIGDFGTESRAKTYPCVPRQDWLSNQQTGQQAGQSATQKARPSSQAALDNNQSLINQNQQPLLSLLRHTSPTHSCVTLQSSWGRRSFWHRLTNNEVHRKYPRVQTQIHPGTCSTRLVSR
jgi:hypothetical protein